MKSVSFILVIVFLSRGIVSIEMSKNEVDEDDAGKFLQDTVFDDSTEILVYAKVRSVSVSTNWAV